MVKPGDTVDCYTIEDDKLVHIKGTVIRCGQGWFTINDHLCYKMHFETAKEAWQDHYDTAVYRLKSLEAALQRSLETYSQEITKVDKQRLLANEELQRLTP